MTEPQPPVPGIPGISGLPTISGPGLSQMADLIGDWSGTGEEGGGSYGEFLAQVLGIYNPLPFDDAGAAQAVAQSWRGAADAVAALHTAVVGSAATAYANWTDQAGFLNRHILLTYAGQLPQLEQGMRDLATMADQYAFQVAKAQAEFWLTIAWSFVPYSRLARLVTRFPFVRGWMNQIVSNTADTIVRLVTGAQAGVRAVTVRLQAFHHAGLGQTGFWAASRRAGVQVVDEGVEEASVQAASIEAAHRNGYGDGTWDSADVADVARGGGAGMVSPAFSMPARRLVAPVVDRVPTNPGRAAFSGFLTNPAGSIGGGSVVEIVESAADGDPDTNFTWSDLGKNIAMGYGPSATIGGLAGGIRGGWSSIQASQFFQNGTPIGAPNVQFSDGGPPGPPQPASPGAGATNPAAGADGGPAATPPAQTAPGAPGTTPAGTAPGAVQGAQGGAGVDQGAAGNGVAPVGVGAGAGAAAQAGGGAPVQPGTAGPAAQPQSTNSQYQQDGSEIFGREQQEEVTGQPNGQQASESGQQETTAQAATDTAKAGSADPSAAPGTEAEQAAQPDSATAAPSAAENGSAERQGSAVHDLDSSAAPAEAGSDTTATAQAGTAESDQSAGPAMHGGSAAAAALAWTAQNSVPKDTSASGTAKSDANSGEDGAPAETGQTQADEAGDAPIVVGDLTAGRFTEQWDGFEERMRAAVENGNDVLIDLTGVTFQQRDTVNKYLWKLWRDNSKTASQITVFGTPQGDKVDIDDLTAARFSEQQGELTVRLSRALGYATRVSIDVSRLTPHQTEEVRALAASASKRAPRVKINLVGEPARADTPATDTHRPDKAELGSPDPSHAQQLEPASAGNAKAVPNSRFRGDGRSFHAPRLVGWIADRLLERPAGAWAPAGIESLRPTGDDTIDGLRVYEATHEAVDAPFLLAVTAAAFPLGDDRPATFRTQRMSDGRFLLRVVVSDRTTIPEVERVLQTEIATGARALAGAPTESTEARVFRRGSTAEVSEHNWNAADHGKVANLRTLRRDLDADVPAYRLRQRWLRARAQREWDALVEDMDVLSAEERLRALPGDLRAAVFERRGGLPQRAPRAQGHEARTRAGEPLRKAARWRGEAGSPELEKYVDRTLPTAELEKLAQAGYPLARSELVGRRSPHGHALELHTVRHDGTGHEYHVVVDSAPFPQGQDVRAEVAPLTGGDGSLLVVTLDERLPRDQAIPTLDRALAEYLQRETPEAAPASPRSRLATWQPTTGSPRLETYVDDVLARQRAATAAERTALRQLEDAGFTMERSHWLRKRSQRGGLELHTVRMTGVSEPFRFVVDTAPFPQGQDVRAEVDALTGGDGSLLVVTLDERLPREQAIATLTAALQRGVSITPTVRARLVAWQPTTASTTLEDRLDDALSDRRHPALRGTGLTIVDSHWLRTASRRGGLWLHTVRVDGTGQTFQLVVDSAGFPAASAQRAVVNRLSDDGSVLVVTVDHRLSGPSAITAVDAALTEHLVEQGGSAPEADPSQRGNATPVPGTHAADGDARGRPARTTIQKVVDRLLRRADPATWASANVTVRPLRTDSGDQEFSPEGLPVHVVHDPETRVEYEIVAVAGRPNSSDPHKPATYRRVDDGRLTGRPRYLITVSDRLFTAGVLPTLTYEFRKLARSLADERDGLRTPATHVFTADSAKAASADPAPSADDDGAQARLRETGRAAERAVPSYRLRQRAMRRQAAADWTALAHSMGILDGQAGAADNRRMLDADLREQADRMDGRIARATERAQANRNSGRSAMELVVRQLAKWGPPSLTVGAALIGLGLFPDAHPWLAALTGGEGDPLVLVTLGASVMLRKAVELPFTGLLERMIVTTNSKLNAEDANVRRARLQREAQQHAEARRAGTEPAPFEARSALALQRGVYRPTLPAFLARRVGPAVGSISVFGLMTTPLVPLLLPIPALPVALAGTVAASVVVPTVLRALADRWAAKRWVADDQWRTDAHTRPWVVLAWAARQVYAEALNQRIEHLATIRPGPPSPDGDARPGASVPELIELAYHLAERGAHKGSRAAVSGIGELLAAASDPAVSEGATAGFWSARTVLQTGFEALAGRIFEKDKRSRRWHATEYDLNRLEHDGLRKYLAEAERHLGELDARMRAADPNWQGTPGPFTEIRTFIRDHYPSKAAEPRPDAAPGKTAVVASALLKSVGGEGTTVALATFLLAGGLIAASPMIALTIAGAFGAAVSPFIDATARAKETRKDEAAAAVRIAKRRKTDEAHIAAVFELTRELADQRASGGDPAQLFVELDALAKSMRPEDGLTHSDYEALFTAFADRVAALRLTLAAELAGDPRLGEKALALRDLLAALGRLERLQDYGDRSGRYGPAEVAQQELEASVGDILDLLGYFSDGTPKRDFDRTVDRPHASWWTRTRLGVDLEGQPATPEGAGARLRAATVRFVDAGIGFIRGHAAELRGQHRHLLIDPRLTVERVERHWGVALRPRPDGGPHDWVDGAGETYHVISDLDAGGFESRMRDGRLEGRLRLVAGTVGQVPVDVSRLRPEQVGRLRELLAFSRFADGTPLGATVVPVGDQVPGEGPTPEQRRRLVEEGARRGRVLRAGHVARGQDALAQAVRMAGRAAGVDPGALSTVADQLGGTPVPAGLGELADTLNRLFGGRVGVDVIGADGSTVTRGRGVPLILLHTAGDAPQVLPVLVGGNAAPVPGSEIMQGQGRRVPAPKRIQSLANRLLDDTAPRAWVRGAELFRQFTREGTPLDTETGNPVWVLRAAEAQAEVVVSTGEQAPGQEHKPATFHEVDGPNGLRRFAITLSHRLPDEAVERTLAHEFGKILRFVRSGATTDTTGADQHWFRRGSEPPVAAAPTPPNPPTPQDHGRLAEAEKVGAAAERPVPRYRLRQRALRRLQKREFEFLAREMGLVAGVRRAALPEATRAMTERLLGPLSEAQQTEFDAHYGRLAPVRDALSGSPLNQAADFDQDRYALSAGTPLERLPHLDRLAEWLSGQLGEQEEPLDTAKLGRILVSDWLQLTSPNGWVFSLGGHVFWIKLDLSEPREVHSQRDPKMQTHITLPRGPNADVRTTRKSSRWFELALPATLTKLLPVRWRQTSTVGTVVDSGSHAESNSAALVNDGEARVYEAKARLTVSRQHPATGHTEASATFSETADGEPGALLVASPPAHFAEPLPQEEIQTNLNPVPAEQMPFAFGQWLTGLEALVDEVIDQLPGSVERTPELRRQVWVHVAQLQSRLPLAVRSGFSFPIEQKGQIVARARIRSEVLRKTARLLGGHQDGIALEHHKLAFEPLRFEVDNATTVEWWAGVPDGLKEVLLPGLADAEVRRSRSTSNALKAGLHTIRIFLDRWVGHSQGYRIGVEHTVSVHPVGAKPSDSRAPRPSSGRTVRGEFVGRLREPDAWEYGLPVPSEAVDEQRNLVRGVPEKDRDEEGNELPDPAWPADLRGVGHGDVRGLHVLDDAADQNDAVARDGDGLAQVRQDVLAALADLDIVDDDRPENRRPWQVRAAARDLRVLNRFLVEHQITSDMLETRYDKLSQDGVASWLLRITPTGAVEHVEVRLRLEQTGADFLGYQPGTVHSHLDLAQSNLAEQTGSATSASATARLALGPGRGRDLSVDAGIANRGNKLSMAETVKGTRAAEFAIRGTLTAEVKPRRPAREGTPSPEEPIPPPKTMAYRVGAQVSRPEAFVPKPGAPRARTITEGGTSVRPLTNTHIAVAAMDTTGLEEQVHAALVSAAARLVENVEARHAIVHDPATQATRSAAASVDLARAYFEQLVETGIRFDIGSVGLSRHHLHVEITAKRAHDDPDRVAADTQFLGWTDDLLHLDIFLDLPAQSTSVTTSRNWSLSLKGSAEQETDDTGQSVSGGGAGSHGRSTGVSHYADQVRGSEDISMALERRFIFSTPLTLQATATVTEAGAPEDQAAHQARGSVHDLDERPVKWTMTESDAIRFHAEGTWNLPPEVVQESVRRWLDGKFQLPADVIAKATTRLELATFPAGEARDPTVPSRVLARTEPSAALRVYAAGTFDLEATEVRRLLREWLDGGFPLDRDVVERAAARLATVARVEDDGLLDEVEAALDPDTAADQAATVSAGWDELRVPPYLEDGIGLGPLVGIEGIVDENGRPLELDKKVRELLKQALGDKDSELSGLLAAADGPFTDSRLPAFADDAYGSEFPVWSGLVRKGPGRSEQVTITVKIEPTGRGRIVAETDQVVRENNEYDYNAKSDSTGRGPTTSGSIPVAHQPGVGGEPQGDAPGGSPGYTRGGATIVGDYSQDSNLVWSGYEKGMYDFAQPVRVILTVSHEPVQRSRVGKAARAALTKGIEAGGQGKRKESVVNGNLRLSIAKGLFAAPEEIPEPRAWTDHRSITSLPYRVGLYAADVGPLRAAVRRVLAQRSFFGGNVEDEAGLLIKRSLTPGTLRSMIRGLAGPNGELAFGVHSRVHPGERVDVRLKLSVSDATVVRVLPEGAGLGAVDRHQDQANFEISRTESGELATASEFDATADALGWEGDGDLREWAAGTGGSVEETHTARLSSGMRRAVLAEERGRLVVVRVRYSARLDVRKYVRPAEGRTPFGAEQPWTRDRHLVVDNAARGDAYVLVFEDDLPLLQRSLDDGAVEADAAETPRWLGLHGVPDEEELTARFDRAYWATATTFDLDEVLAEAETEAGFDAARPHLAAARSLAERLPSELDEQPSSRSERRARSAPIRLTSVAGPDKDPLGVARGVAAELGRDVRLEVSGSGDTVTGYTINPSGGVRPDAPQAWDAGAVEALSEQDRSRAEQRRLDLRVLFDEAVRTGMPFDRAVADAVNRAAAEAARHGVDVDRLLAELDQGRELTETQRALGRSADLAVAFGADVDVTIEPARTRAEALWKAAREARARWEDELPGFVDAVRQAALSREDLLRVLLAEPTEAGLFEAYRRALARGWDPVQRLRSVADSRPDHAPPATLEGLARLFGFDWTQIHEVHADSTDPGLDDGVLDGVRRFRDILLAAGVELDPTAGPAARVPPAAAAMSLDVALHLALRYGLDAGRRRLLLEIDPEWLAGQFATRLSTQDTTAELLAAPSAEAHVKRDEGFERVLRWVVDRYYHAAPKGRAHRGPDIGADQRARLRDALRWGGVPYAARMATELPGSRFEGDLSEEDFQRWTGDPNVPTGRQYGTLGYGEAPSWIPAGAHNVFDAVSAGLVGVDAATLRKELRQALLAELSAPASERPLWSLVPDLAYRENQRAAAESLDDTDVDKRLAERLPALLARMRDLRITVVDAEGDSAVAGTPAPGVTPADEVRLWRTGRGGEPHYMTVISTVPGTVEPPTGDPAPLAPAPPQPPTDPGPAEGDLAARAAEQGIELRPRDGWDSVDWVDQRGVTYRALPGLTAANFDALWNEHRQVALLGSIRGTFGFADKALIDMSGLRADQQERLRSLLGRGADEEFGPLFRKRMVLVGAPPVAEAGHPAEGAFAAAAEAEFGVGLWRPRRSGTEHDWLDRDGVTYRGVAGWTVEDVDGWSDTSLLRRFADEAELADVVLVDVSALRPGQRLRLNDLFVDVRNRRRAPLARIVLVDPPRPDAAPEPEPNPVPSNVGALVPREGQSPDGMELYKLLNGWHEQGVRDNPKIPPLDRLSVPDDRLVHILTGDATGGGHRPGTGKPGKTEFPVGWSDEFIVERIYDVVRSPDAGPRKPEWNTNDDIGFDAWKIYGVRRGVGIVVVVNQDGTIHGAWPEPGGRGVVTNARVPAPEAQPPGNVKVRARTVRRIMKTFGPESQAPGANLFPASWTDSRSAFAEILVEAGNRALDEGKFIREELKSTSRWWLDAHHDGVVFTIVVDNNGDIDIAWPEAGYPGVTTNPEPVPNEKAGAHDAERGADRAEDGNTSGSVRRPADSEGSTGRDGVPGRGGMAVHGPEPGGRATGTGSADNPAGADGATSVPGGVRSSGSGGQAGSAADGIDAEHHDAHRELTTPAQAFVQALKRYIAQQEEALARTTGDLAALIADHLGVELSPRAGGDMNEWVDRHGIRYTAIGELTEENFDPAWDSGELPVRIRDASGIADLVPIDVSALRAAQIAKLRALLAQPRWGEHGPVLGERAVLVGVPRRPSVLDAMRGEADAGPDPRRAPSDILTEAALAARNRSPALDTAFAAAVSDVLAEWRAAMAELGRPEGAEMHTLVVAGADVRALYDLAGGEADGLRAALPAVLRHGMRAVEQKWEQLSVQGPVDPAEWQRELRALWTEDGSQPPESAPWTAFLP